MPELFHDSVQHVGPTAVDKANRVDLGTITLSQKASSIRKVWAEVTTVGTPTVNKPVFGYITLESEDCSIQPFKFPFAPTATGLSGTANVLSFMVDKPEKWLVNCPVPGGARINVYATLQVAAPVGAPEITVCIEYSDGSPEGTQLHMEVLEPSAGIGTTDGTVTTLSTITIKAASKLVLIWATAGLGTQVDAEAVVPILKITSDEFAVAGPCRFPLSALQQGDATASVLAHITRLETERNFKNAPSDAVLQPETTIYDANNAAAEICIGVAYI